MPGHHNESMILLSEPQHIYSVLVQFRIEAQGATLTSLVQVNQASSCKKKAYPMFNQWPAGVREGSSEQDSVY